MLRKIIGAVSVAALLAGLMPAAALAQGPADKRTYFTFNQPVALPGVTLEAGTYMFRLADPNSRRVVQVLSEDGSESYAMLISIPAQRLEGPDEPEIQFMETAANTPAAVKMWWMRGETVGHEFLYPQEQMSVLSGEEPESQH